jgi:hypothetical protein
VEEHLDEFKAGHCYPANVGHVYTMADYEHSIEMELSGSTE